MFELQHVHTNIHTKNTAQTGDRGRLELAVECTSVRSVLKASLWLRWRTAIKALFLCCFEFRLVRVGILCHEFIHHIPSLLLFHSLNINSVVIGGYHSVRSLTVLVISSFILNLLQVIYIHIVRTTIFFIDYKDRCTTLNQCSTCNWHFTLGDFG